MIFTIGLTFHLNWKDYLHLQLREGLAIGKHPHHTHDHEALHHGETMLHENALFKLRTVPVDWQGQRPGLRNGCGVDKGQAAVDYKGDAFHFCSTRLPRQGSGASLVFTCRAQGKNEEGPPRKMRNCTPGPMDPESFRKGRATCSGFAAWRLKPMDGVADGPEP